MIVVTGTKRSGTSMWMQILAAAGVSVVGSQFPSNWGEAIRQANPRGFFESRLRNGIYYRTNPNPENGEFIHPAKSRKHAIKVFVPGLIRTDMAFLDRVLICVRDWREYVLSVTRLFEMEDEFLLSKDPEGDETAEQRLARIQAKRVKVPRAVEWWFENYDIVRDASVRRYPYHFVHYGRTISQPEEVVRNALQFLGNGKSVPEGLNLEAAIAAVDTDLHRVQQTPLFPNEGDWMDPEGIATMDAYCQALAEGRPLERDLLVKLNELHHQVQDRFDPLSKEREVR